MSSNSKIEWTRGDDGSPGATWNFLLGCDKVSGGCANCYAVRQVHRMASNPNPKIAEANAGLTAYHKNGKLDWTGKVNVVRSRLDTPLSWRQPKRVFVNSLSDLFHADVSTDVLDEAFSVMAATPHHTYQLLTKRPERMHEYLSDATLRERVERLMSARAAFRGGCLDEAETWPLPNVWVGVSVEDQKTANQRIPLLADTPAAIRWLSCEPLLGPVDLEEWFSGDAIDRADAHERNTGHRTGDAGGGTWCCGECNFRWGPFEFRDIDWVVVGGESGPGARPMHPDWARALRDQCAAAEVAYFFKQRGDWSWDYPSGVSLAHREQTHQHGQTFYRVGKHAAGRELDGRTWDEYPLTEEMARVS